MNTTNCTNSTVPQSQAPANANPIPEIRKNSGSRTRCSLCCCLTRTDDSEVGNCQEENHAASSNCTSPKKTCPLPTKMRPHIPNSTKVYIVLTWIALTHCLYNYTVFNVGGLLSVGRFNPYPLYIIGATQVLTLLLYPLAGIIGEVYFTRFNILRVSTGIMLVTLLSSPVLLSALLLIESREERDALGGILIAVALIPFQFGVAIFESNIIQFGTDQLLFASSDMLSNFVHWTFWCMYLFPAATVTLMCPFSALYSMPPDARLASVMVGPLVAGIGLIVATVIILLPCTKRHLHIEKGSKKNPLRLIYGVLKYAANNKYPIARSAFTYNDEESQGRIDFAKKRFGGPFTTEEVEDVKTFWRITALVLSLFGVLQLDNTGVFIEQYITVLEYIQPISRLESVTQCVVHNYGPMLYVVVIGVPIHKLILQPYFYRYIPNMTKRMGIGLFLACASLAVETAISFVLNKAFDELGFVNSCGQNMTDFQNNQTYLQNNMTLAFPSKLISQYVLVVPQALNGFSMLLVFLTTLEFIIAQAPRSMQGLLIGCWYLFQSVNVVNSTLFSTTLAGCDYISYNLRFCLAVLSFLIFIFTSLWYKGRMRQELSLIKLKTIIENYTVRSLRHEQAESAGYDCHGSADPYSTEGEYDLSVFTIYSINSEQAQY